MRRYHEKNQKSRGERIGFYTALTICLIAICMAVYSTYSSVTDVKKAAPVANQVTDVAVYNQPATHESIPEPTLGEHFSGNLTIPTATADPVTDPPATTEPATTEPSTTMGRADALETMLAADVSLSPPTKSGHVLRPYSRESVYNKVLNTWKPHTGADFDGALGEDVTAMLGGEVTKIYDDKMLGKTVEVTVNNVIHGYSGMGEIAVKQGDKVERGDKLGTIGAVPSEAGDKNHIHVTIKVNNAYADPLSFIGNGD